MKKLNLFLLLFFIGSLVFAQDSQNASLTKKDAIRKYLRPSITVLYIDRGEELNSRLINQMISNGISGKFNINPVSNEIIKIGGTFNDSILKVFIEENYTKEIMKVWFPFDKAKGEYSTNLIAERGMYNATDADVMKAEASQRAESMLKDAGLDLIGRSFILVYDFNKTSYDKTKETNGYSTKCSAYLYQIDWNPEVEAKFYEQWKNPNAIDQLYFPIKKIGVVPSKALQTSQSNQASILTVSDAKLFEVFAANVASTMDIHLTKINEDFQVKSPIAKTAPIRAKIGIKEGVKIDQRYFVYEMELNSAGEKVEKRRGVVRATSKIAKNDTISTGDSKMTKFYQTYGQKLYEGMLLKQKPDLGLGISASVGTDLNVALEANLTQWIGKYVPALNNMTFVPSGMKLYIRFTSPFSDPSYSYYSFGLSKDIYFARIFSLSPYVGASSSVVTEGMSGYELGVNGAVALLHNFQIIGGLGYNTYKSVYLGSGINFGVGARVQF
jgi:hypothetical protein